MTSAETGSNVTDLDYMDIRRLIVVYSNYRSGTNLLRSGLHSILQAPDLGEVFLDHQQNRNPLLEEFTAKNPHLSSFSHEHRKLFLEQYLAYLVGTTPNFAPALIDIKYSQAFFCGALNNSYPLPLTLKTLSDFGCRVIHLIRKDVVAQAISNALAQQTDIYRVEADGAFEASPIVLDPEDVVRQARASLAAQEQGRQNLITAGCVPINVYYEDLINNYRGQLRRILGRLDHYAEIPQDAKPKTKRIKSSAFVLNLSEIKAYLEKNCPELVYSYT